jgi:hypothetical protein
LPLKLQATEKREEEKKFMNDANTCERFILPGMKETTKVAPVSMTKLRLKKGW